MICQFKDGNSKEDPLEMKYKIRGRLTKNVLSIKEPETEYTREYYKDCVQSVAIKLRDVQEQDFLEPAFSCDYPNYHFL